ncbi:GlcNAc-transferase family protein [Salinispora arenicola]|uniref:GlcNAc-transferase family protein n=1 Tax=Salinispora arenicola TaxID=168697 RepID=UPI00036B8B01|nr:GlcNAc-transferase family protein [Salinispora arenicola]
MTVFVSVASYRDSELVSTVLDCLAKAERPDKVHIVVCWQHLGDEDVSAIADNPRVELLDFDARDSRGACWARAQVMRHYADQDWFLQVDSHTRFVDNWDTRLIATADATGAAKPVVTCYPPTYDPATEFTGEGVPSQTVVAEWTHDGLPVYAQRTIEDRSGRPVPAHFVAGGFLFAPGTFVREVPYDPNIYFHGEEISVALRAYTWGYDLFHPTEVLGWHYYIREEHPRHWTDHVGTNGGKSWTALDRASRRRVNNLLRNPSVGRYGIGPVRSLADYEAYSGCDFRRRTWTNPV